MFHGGATVRQGGPKVAQAAPLKPTSGESQRAKLFRGLLVYEDRIPGCRITNLFVNARNITWFEYPVNDIHLRLQS